MYTPTANSQFVSSVRSVPRLISPRFPNANNRESFKGDKPLAGPSSGSMHHAPYPAPRAHPATLLQNKTHPTE